jgi:hypothetical protein
MNSYTFEKEPDLDKLKVEIETSVLSDKFSHLEVSKGKVTVYCSDLVDHELKLLELIVKNHNIKKDKKFYNAVINSAINFGHKIMVEFASENVMMGITQAGKTKEVANYLTDVARHIQTGSLYEVINEIDRLKIEGLPQDLSPFITETRLDRFKQKILDYLM